MLRDVVAMSRSFFLPLNSTNFAKRLTEKDKIELCENCGSGRKRLANGNVVVLGWGKE